MRRVKLLLASHHDRECAPSRSSGISPTFILYRDDLNLASKILTHDLELDDVAVAVTLDVAGDAGVISGLRAIHLAQR